MMIYFQIIIDMLVVLFLLGTGYLFGIRKTVKEIVERRTIMLNALLERTPKDSEFNKGVHAAYREELEFLKSLVEASKK